MGTIKARDYSCKDEELSAICMFAAFSLNRDLADFTAFSSKFSTTYLKEFETRIAATAELIEPKSETLQLKIISSSIRETFNGLIDPINRLTGYINLSEVGSRIPLADFGIKYLRKSLAYHDAEGVIQSLRTIIINIAKYKEALTAQGLTEDLISVFTVAAASVAEDKQKQYTILSNRRQIVQNNLAILNRLFGQLNEILTVGKILYKSADATRVQEYTFSELKKRVHRTAKPAAGVKKVVVAQ